MHWTPGDRLPIFVYGTLRPNGINDRIWTGRATHHFDGEALACDYRLVHNRAFPYAIPDAGSLSVGCLIRPYPDTYRDIIARMDLLEGVAHNFYARVPARIALPDQCSEIAWLYTPVHPEQYEHLPHVPGNNWGVSDELEPA